MPFKTLPQSVIQVSTFNVREEYFCKICLTESGQARINSNDPCEQFVDVHITKSQALQLLEQLKIRLEETDETVKREDRYINGDKTEELYLNDPADIWNFTEEELNRLGWQKSNEPLNLSNKTCPTCQGSRRLFTSKYSGNITLHKKCDVCDGTGKQLLNSL